MQTNVPEIASWIKQVCSFISARIILISGIFFLVPAGLFPIFRLSFFFALYQWFRDTAKSHGRLRNTWKKIYISYIYTIPISPPLLKKQLRGSRKIGAIKL